jgi:hypothetical protein
MTILGFIVFLAGLMLLWAAVTNHKIGDAVKAVASGNYSAVKK